MINESILYLSLVGRTIFHFVNFNLRRSKQTFVVIYFNMIGGLSFNLLPAASRSTDPAPSVYPGQSRCDGSYGYEAVQMCMERKSRFCDKQT